MRNQFWMMVPLLVVSGLSKASDNQLAVGYAYTDYSGGHGDKNILFAELKNKIEKGTLVSSLETGGRNYVDNEKKRNGTRGKMTFYYDWNPRLTTRSAGAIADKTEMFARYELLHDFNFKFLKGTVFTVGGRHAHYYDDVNVNSWSAGISYYTGPVMLSWRYSRYNDTSEAGNSYSHVASLKLKDKSGRGNTQLWVGTGTGAYTYDWTPELRKGKQHSVSLRRLQPLTERLALSVAVGKHWYELPLYHYTGFTGQLSLEYVL